MALDIEVKKEQEGIFTVSPAGSIDSETYLDLEERVNIILTPSLKLLVFDMGEVTYISSMGLGAILKIKGLAEKNKGLIIISNLQPQVKKVFDILKALPEHIFKDMEEADSYITEIQKREIEKRNG